MQAKVKKKGETSDKSNGTGYAQTPAHAWNGKTRPFSLRDDVDGDVEVP